MQKVTESQKVLGRLMQRFGKKIEQGECGLSENEIDALTELIATRELSMEQSADYLNMDRSTLSRRIHDEQLPQPRKDKGKRKFFFLKDLFNFKKKEG